MTTPPVKPSIEPSQAIEVVRSAAARTGLLLAFVLLSVGLAMTLSGQVLAPTVLAAATACLVAVPLIGIVTLIIEVVRHREWPYVRATILIVLLLLYSLASGLREL